MRVRTKRDCVIGSTFYGAGIETNMVGWPKAIDVEPVDDEAKRVASFYRRHANNPSLPLSPYDPKTAGLYLPGIFRDAYFHWGLHDVVHGGFKMPPVFPLNDASAVLGMPAYEIGHGYGDRIPAGSSMICLAWPVAQFNLSPHNAAAHRVQTYMNAAIYQRRFGLTWESMVDGIPSPWCHAKNGLHLPYEAEVLAARGAAESPVVVIAA